MFKTETKTLNKNKNEFNLILKIYLAFYYQKNYFNHLQKFLSTNDFVVHDVILFLHKARR